MVDSGVMAEQIAAHFGDEDGGGGSGEGNSGGALILFIVTSIIFLFPLTSSNVPKTNNPKTSILDISQGSLRGQMISVITLLFWEAAP